MFCASGEAACNGACIPVTSDRANCGSCGVACPAGAICTGGACVFCASDRVVCNNTCVDIATDAAN
ncbi:MAG: hypothetical protein QM692_19540 [Thermomicrobiales bacterium]